MISQEAGTEAHEQGRAGGAVQGLPAQGEAGPEQNDDEGDFAEIRRNRHHFRAQQPQDMGPHQDAHQEHAHQARHFQAAEEVIGSQTQDDDQGQADGHPGFLQQGHRAAKIWHCLAGHGEERGWANILPDPQSGEPRMVPAIY